MQASWEADVRQRHTIRFPPLEPLPQPLSAHTSSRILHTDIPQAVPLGPANMKILVSSSLGDGLRGVQTGGGSSLLPLCLPPCDSSLNWQEDSWLGASLIRKCYQQASCAFIEYRALWFDCTFERAIQCGEVLGVHRAQVPPNPITRDIPALAAIRN